MAKTDTPGDAGDNSSPTTNTDGTEKEVKKVSGVADTGAIYVDESVPAILGYLETSESYSNVREARAAWLSLVPEVKKGASITIKGGACYRGWEIYQLFLR